MAEFCARCGSRLNKKTGLCPNCDRKKGSVKRGILNFFVGVLYSVLIIVVLSAGLLGALICFDVIDIADIQWGMEATGEMLREVLQYWKEISEYLMKLISGKRVRVR